MAGETGTLGWLIHTILREHGVSEEAFGERLRVKRSTVYRWEDNLGIAADLPFTIISELADIVGVSAAEIFFRIGINLFEAPMKNRRVELDNLLRDPLLVGVVESDSLWKAVEAARRGQWAYCFDGVLKGTVDGIEKGVLFEYERALDFANEAGATRLATYMKKAVANLYEMTGRIDEAEKLIEEALDEAQAVEAEGREAQDEVLTWLGARMVIEIKIRWLWTHRWARNISSESIADGLALVADMGATSFYRRFPHPYIFLARCAVGIGEFEQALHFMELAELREFSLSNERFPHYETFLDVEPSIRNGKDYTWKEDQVLAAKADILIAAGRPEEAFGVYRMITMHRRPRAYLCLHNWFNPVWQDVLKRQTVLTEDNDIKLAYSFEEWDEELEESQDVHVRALNTFSQGENDIARGDYLTAGWRFEAARSLAVSCQAEYLEVKSGIAASRAAAAIQKKGLAITRLNVIEKKLHRTNNPLLWEQYRLAEEAIRQL